MSIAAPLPHYLVEGYHAWKEGAFADNARSFRRLAEDGQTPPSLVISCCDSRVHAISIFGAEHGEFFTHRNIANIVPPYEPNGDQHGTSAAVEYAVTALHVRHIVVLGHSACGGVMGCHAKCSGQAPHLEDATSFVGRWVEYLRPAYDRVAHLPTDEQVPAMEREGVLMSLENLMGFPFVKEAVESGALSLHGLWTDIGDGRLEGYNPETEKFEPL